MLGVVERAVLVRVLSLVIPVGHGSSLGNAPDIAPGSPQALTHGQWVPALPVETSGWLHDPMVESHPSTADIGVRNGYDEDFLGTTTEVPVPSDERLTVLDYVHFSVHQDTDRRLAAITAVNIDGTRLRDVVRGDDWRFDERLPEEHQSGEALYAGNGRSAGSTPAQAVHPEVVEVMRERGAFFGSVHGTLNHLVLTDRIWWTSIGVTVFINWAVKPFSRALLGWIFIRHVFAPYLPAEQLDSYVAGLILLAAAPSSWWSVIASAVTSSVQNSTSRPAASISRKPPLLGSSQPIWQPSALNCWSICASKSASDRTWLVKNPGALGGTRPKRSVNP